MNIIDDATRKEVQEIFKNLTGEVKLIVFSRDNTIIIPGYECPTCKDNETLIQEIGALSDKITCKVYDHLRDKDEVQACRIDKIPATLVHGNDDSGIRFFGIPSGHEFSALLNAIKIVSSGDPCLSQETLDMLSKITDPVHIQVFVTPSCPYCAPAVELAHSMALGNNNITADMVNANDFPELAQQYTVHTVPKIIINEHYHTEGALSESTFAERLMSAVSI
jgi:glutaredoxin-like protein